MAWILRRRYFLRQCTWEIHQGLGVLALLATSTRICETPIRCLKELLGKVHEQQMSKLQSALQEKTESKFIPRPQRCEKTDG